MSKILKGRLAPVWLVIVVAVIVSFVTRFGLLLSSPAGIGLGRGIALFGVGFLYDVGVAAASSLLLLVYLWFQNNFIYQRKVATWVSTAFAVLLGLLIFTNILPKDYNRQVHQALVIYVAVRFGIYLLLLFLPYRFRMLWRQGMLYFFFILIVFLLLLNAVSEWFFWQEFSVRYNFIAVDYLIYTNEVIGNIVQSYHIS